MTRLCPVCHQPLDVCPYGGDCGEIQLIARERQREINADIDISDMVECCDCRSALCEPGELYCYDCTRGVDNTDDTPYCEPGEPQCYNRGGCDVDHRRW